MIQKKKDQLERTLKPKFTFDQRVEQAHSFLPQVLDERKLQKALKGGSTRGVINMNRLMELMETSGGLAYRIRDRLLRDLGVES